MKQNATSSDSFGSIDEEVLKELKNVPAVLATQDEMDVMSVARGLRHRLKVQHPTCTGVTNTKDLYTGRPCHHRHKAAYT
jgi:hypothetical protein